jgi:hypothetical protein
MRTALTFAAMLAAATLAAPGSAQYGNGPGGPYPAGYGQRHGPPRAILYTKPGFQGRSLVVDRPIGKLERFDFDDKPSSIQIRGGGAWRICEDDHLGGRCEIVDRSIDDLRIIHMDNKVSSIAPVGPGPGGPPPAGY